jgi:hypothetical protein
MWQVPSAVLAVVAWLTAPPTSLGDIAQREAVRRLAAPKATVTLSNIGLPTEPEPASSVTLPPPPVADPDVAAPPDPPVPPGADAKEEKKDEKWWRERVASAREAIDQGVAAVMTIQTRINKLESDAVNLDDPAQQARARTELAEAIVELRKTNEKIEADRRALAAIQGEARRLNVPAGWVR